MTGRLLYALVRAFEPGALEPLPSLQNLPPVEIARRVAEGFTVGDPTTGEFKLGPLISAAQRDRVRAFIQQGIDEGATLVTGGPEAPPGLEKGFFVRPTVFANVRQDMTIAQEEIFGPVLSILPYDDEEEAIRIANDTIYGLGGGVLGLGEAAGARQPRPPPTATTATPTTRRSGRPTCACRSRRRRRARSSGTRSGSCRRARAPAIPGRPWRNRPARGASPRPCRRGARRRAARAGTPCPPAGRWSGCRYGHHCRHRS